jgi:hypothetical protein
MNMGGSEIAFWVTPVSPQRVKSLIADCKVFGIGPNSPGRSSIKPEDKICFYSTGLGIVGYATVASSPASRPGVISPIFPIVFDLKDIVLFQDNPKVLGAVIRNQLDAFGPWKGSQGTAWGRFVRALHRISEHDFRLLTGQSNEKDPSWKGGRLS